MNIKKIIKKNETVLRLAKKLYDYLPDTKYITKYDLQILGGKAVCVDMIPVGSTIISGGVGNDIEFERALIYKKNVNVIGYDPTDTAENFISGIKDRKVNSNYHFNKKAISHESGNIKIYYGENDFMVSTSSKHQNVIDNKSKICEAIGFNDLINSHKNLSYVKLDIEGPEYEIIEKLDNININQISIEFHHHCDPNYSIQDTLQCLEKMMKMGYQIYDYGQFHGRKRGLPKYISKWSDLNCEFLFIKD